MAVQVKGTRTCFVQVMNLAHYSFSFSTINRFRWGSNISNVFVVCLIFNRNCLIFPNAELSSSHLCVRIVVVFAILDDEFPYSLNVHTVLDYQVICFCQNRVCYFKRIELKVTRKQDKTNRNLKNVALMTL